MTILVIIQVFSTSSIKTVYVIAPQHRSCLIYSYFLLTAPYSLFIPSLLYLFLYSPLFLLYSFCLFLPRFSLPPSIFSHRSLFLSYFLLLSTLLLFFTLIIISLSFFANTFSITCLTFLLCLYKAFIFSFYLLTQFFYPCIFDPYIFTVGFLLSILLLFLVFSGQIHCKWSMDNLMGNVAESIWKRTRNIQKGGTQNNVECQIMPQPIDLTWKKWLLRCTWKIGSSFEIYVISSLIIFPCFHLFS